MFFELVNLYYSSSSKKFDQMDKLQKLIALTNRRIPFKKTAYYRCMQVQYQTNSIDNIKYKYANHKHILYSSYLERGLSPARGSEVALSKTIPIKSNNKQQNAYLKALKSARIPINWMEEYEFYAGPSVTSAVGSILGSVDVSIPPSDVPCNGCGAYLHCAHHAKPGFIPVEIFKGRTVSELKTIICQRCHFLKFYNIALDIEVTAEFYTDALSRIRDDYALAVVIIDLLDFPCSIWPKMHELLGPKRPIMIVGNKVDLLPRCSDDYLVQVKACLETEIIKFGFDRLNIKHISLISAKTGFGIEELVTKLQHVWSYDGNVYLIGCTNVGKSSLFNILLTSDYSRPESMKLIPEATACPWPGTTLQLLRFPISRPTSKRKYERSKRLREEQLAKSIHTQHQILQSCQLADAIPSGSVNRTPPVPSKAYMKYAAHRITSIDENMKIYQKAKWVYDTPGVMHPEQITDLLTAEELLQMQPQEMIKPRAFRLEIGTSLFVAGLARLDLIEIDAKLVDSIQIFLFASPNLPTLLVNSEQALDVYNKYLNTPLLQIPYGDKERMSKWPGLKCPSNDLFAKGTFLQQQRNGSMESKSICSADIVLSSVGWVGLKIPNNIECRFRAWTPYARGVHLRKPSLIPYANRLIGRRIKNSLAYNVSKPFVFKK